MTIRKIIILFFVSINQLVFGQHQINGSYEFKTYTAEQGFSRFYKYDFNFDGTKDLLLVGKDDKKVMWLKLKPDGEVEEIINKFFFYPVSNIEKFKVIPGSGETHLFTSRTKRMIGLVSITKYGTLQLLNEIRFESYPSEIVTGDFNRDKVIDALAYGNSFEGIALIQEDKFKLSETKLIGKGLFSELTVVDLNTDGHKDFIAFNDLDNSLYFFENSDTSVFTNIRKLEMNRDIDHFSSVYFNDDEYPDLVYSTEKSVEIMLGDSVSSYKRNIILDVEKGVKDFVVVDFNGDNKNDLVVLTKNGISVSYMTGLETLSDLYEFDRVENPSAIVNTERNNIFYYSTDGKINALRYLSTFEQDADLKYSLEHKSINTAYFNGVYYLSFIDRLKSKFVLVSDFLSDRSNVKEISVQNISVQKASVNQRKGFIDFYLINKEQDFIEIVSLNQEENSLEKKNLVMEGNLITFYTKEQNDNFILVSKKDSTLSFSAFDFENENLTDLQDTFEVTDTLEFMINPEKVFSIESINEKIFLKEIETGKTVKSIPVSEFISFDNKPWGIGVIVLKKSILILHKGIVKEIFQEVENIDEKNLKVLNQNKIAYVDAISKKLFLADLTGKNPVVKSFDISIKENFNLTDFQVIETLLIFTASDGTLNIQELK